MNAKRTWFGAAFVSAFLVAAASSQASANLISDGDFNNGNADYATVNAGDSSTIPSWTVTQGSVDLIGGYWQSPSGPNAPSGTNGSVDLDGYYAVGGISQQVTLADGT